MKQRVFAVLCSAALALTACAQTQSTRTSGDTMLIQTSAPPACSIEQTTQVAHKMVAVETIRAGYDRFIVLESDIHNNVTEETLPGSYSHTGSMLGNTYSGTSRYTPGATVQHGRNEVSFHIRMFRAQDADAYKAISARDLLGPDWQSAVADGVNSCT